MVCLFFGFFCSVLLSAQRNRPNVIFIMMDDLGYGHCQFNNEDLQVADFDPFFMSLVEQRQDYTPEEALEFSKRAMPTMTRLAEEGLVFTQAYSASSLCAPARLAVATGKTLPELGVYANLDVEADGLVPGTHLAEVFQEAGYGTAHIGKWHVAARDGQLLEEARKLHGIQKPLDLWGLRKEFPDVYDKVWEAGYYGSVRPHQNPLANGFDYYYGYNNWASQFYDSTLVWEGYEHAGRQSGYNTEVFTDKALQFMEEQLKETKPFYLQLHYHAVHDYLEPNVPERYQKYFASESYALRTFYGHIFAVDANVKRIIQFLKENEVYENTLLVFTSDNGAMAGGPSVLPGNAPFSGHKGTFHLGGIRVPMFAHWPCGVIEEGERAQLVSTMDILPTCLDAAGLFVPEGLDGKSLLPLFSGEDLAEVRSEMVWSGIQGRRWGFLIRTSFKGHYTELPFAPGAWAVKKGNYLLRFVGPFESQVYHEAPEGSPGEFYLYNIEKDPGERNDLSREMPEMVERLKAVYLEDSRDFIAPRVWSREKWESIRGLSETGDGSL
ncbi:MAG: sulfatase [Coraliomargaritaceae bacterium]